tara:strand:- start:242 stop:1729 length:1488 start_codon:yes stop_codon:yes gene_type:complete
LITNDKRILIVTFDALRPDMVTPQLMPNLCCFREKGVFWPKMHSTFPTETRVNQTAVITGCYPERHGIVGNRFVDPVAAPGRLFDTGVESQLREGDKRLGGKLLEVPSLGELLQSASKSFATISAGTPGGGRMLNHKAEELGGFRMALHAPEATVGLAPPGQRCEVEYIEKNFGPIPKHEIPALDWNAYATRVYLDYVEPKLRPDVAILWLSEPDTSYHEKGIGSNESLSAARCVDQLFGQILANCGIGSSSDLQIITLSDHGQITVASQKLNLSSKLKAAGFSVDETLEGGADVALALSSAGGLYVRDSDPRLIKAIVDWIQGEDWCGPVSTKDGDCTLKHTDLMWDHDRTPDIGLILKADDRENEYGYMGHTFHDSGYSAGGGIHGGLYKSELNNWLAASGSMFKSEQTIDIPAGNVDLLPTILFLLGIDVPSHVQGRVLLEALNEMGDNALPTVNDEEIVINDRSGRRTILSKSHVNGTQYINSSWVEGGFC